MTHQTQFISADQQPPSLPPPPNEAPEPTYRTRIFYYNGQGFSDPGPEYTTQAVLETLAKTFPELRNGSWSSTVDADGFEAITFFKVTGEKGLALQHEATI